MIRASLIALALAAPAAAGPIGDVTQLGVVSGWDAAVSSYPDGTLECQIMKASADETQGFSVRVRGDDTGYLQFFDGSWNAAARKVDLVVVIDELSIPAPSLGDGPSIFAEPLGDGLLDALAAGSRISLRTPAGKVLFTTDLRGSLDAIDALAECFEKIKVIDPLGDLGPVDPLASEGDPA